MDEQRFLASFYRTAPGSYTPGISPEGVISSMPLHFRQGDLLFIRQDMRPTATLVARPGTVIVAGEATGHAHRLTAGTILEASNGELYLDITHTAQVVHEEHGPIILEPGLWLVVRQREYHPEATREVSD
jgi:hypothetical protein